MSGRFVQGARLLCYDERVPGTESCRVESFVRTSPKAFHSPEREPRKFTRKRKKNEEMFSDLMAGVTVVERGWTIAIKCRESEKLPRPTKFKGENEIEREREAGQMCRVWFLRPTDGCWQQVVLHYQRRHSLHHLHERKKGNNNTKIPKQEWEKLLGNPLKGRFIAAFHTKIS